MTHPFSNYIKKYSLLLGTGISLFIASAASAQTYLETYGQNRVQYRKFDWRFFDTEHFRVYHYDAAGRELARFIAEQAENDITVVEQKMGGTFPNRFKIILYNSYDEYRQTNIGKKDDSQFQDVPAGTVDLAGDRLVVYFTGVHSDLRRQLRAGMSKVILQRMLFGENFREMVKNAVLLNLPVWTTEGFVSYLVDGWDSRTDSEWKNLVGGNPEKNFHELAEINPEIAGKAFWKYISDTYGDNAMKNLLYAMELKSSLNQGVKLTLGQTAKQTYDSCVNYYKRVYSADSLIHQVADSNYQILEIPIPLDNSVLRSVRVSPKGSDVAYVVWKEGEYNVYLHKTKDEQTRAVILSGGQKNHNEKLPDPDYPLLAWSNNGYKLAILYRQGTKTKLRIYNSLKARIENYTIPDRRFDRLTGISFTEDDRKLIFSAIRRSQSDLYEFTIRGSRMNNITNDAWDDMQPWFVSGGSRKGIIFLSNRPEPSIDVPIGINELPVGPLQAYFYNTKTKSTQLLRCSDFKTGNITQPIQYGSDNFAFLYDANGVRNKYVVVFGRDQQNRDSAYAVPVTNYFSDIISHQYNPASNQVADVIKEGNSLKIYFRPLVIPGKNIDPVVPQPTTLSQEQTRAVSPSRIIRAPQINTSRPSKQETGSILKQGTAFRTEFSDAPAESQEQVKDAEEIAVIEKAAPEEFSNSSTTEIDSTYIKMRAQPYRLSLKPDFFTVRLDNSILFMKYQSVQQTPGNFSNPALGGLLSVSLNDVMENHRFTGGIRLPVTFSGVSYFLQYENFTRRVDWGLLFLRNQQTYTVPVTFIDAGSGIPLFTREYLGKNATNMIQGSASYPFDRIRSIRMHMGVRQDVLDFKAQDALSLEYLPRDHQYWAMSRAEFIFDNSNSPTLNITEGYRYKFFAEYMYKLSNGNGGFYNFGTDFRYYHKIYKHFIVATRVAAAHSAGDQKILYYLGGVDNWMAPKFNQNSPPPSDGKFAFQALATNMRGYQQNARNGSTYAVFNGELRLPLVTTFARNHVQSAILRHMQLVPFIDMGSAWHGLLPNSENTSNTYRFGPDQQAPNVTMELKVPGTGGMAVGYGTGLRTMLFGYFLRLDAAWNIEGRRKPIWYFSIGTDF